MPRMKVFIQNEAGSFVKHSHDEKTLERKREERVSGAYPFPYGFILGTTAEDGEIDHNVLAVLHGKDPQLNTEVQQTLTEFVRHVFDHIPGKSIQTGEFGDSDVAVAHVAEYRD